MADTNQGVGIVAIIAIIIIVGLAIYFVRQEADDDVEVDLGARSVLVMPESPAAHQPASFRPGLTLRT